MRVIPKYLFVTVVLALSFVNVSGQKTKPAAKAPVKRPTDPRLIPPPLKAYKHSLEVTSTYDRFENKTLVQFRIQLNSVEAMYMNFGFTGETPKEVPKGILFQYFADPDKLLLTPTEVIFLTDRDRFRLKLGSLPPLDNGKVPFFAVIDYPTFLKIANGTSVAFKIGSTENDFDDEGLEALKDFASRTNPKADRSTEVAQSSAVKKDLLAEAQKLRNLTPKAKAEVKDLLDGIEMLDMALRKATSSNPPDGQGIEISKGLASSLLLKSQSLSVGSFKQLITWSLDDAMSALLLSGSKVGVFDPNDPGVKEIISKAIVRNKLNDYPEKDHYAILLSSSEEALFHAKTIAGAARILEIK